MTTPTGRREDEPIDGPVRQLLWRLRARMVTPPSERRANADLDRLISLARVQAHEAPSAGATPNPAAGDGLPLVGLPVGVDELSERRGRFAAVHSLTRVAAAAMVFVAFGAGLAGARDGSVTLTTLFGRDEAPEADPMALEGPDALTLEPGGETADGTEGDGATGAPLPADGNDTVGADAAEGTEANDTEAPDAAEAPGPAPAAPAPAPPRSEEQIVAAPPPPDDLLGSGGPTPCDQPKLEDCLPDDADDADDGEGSVEDGVEDEPPSEVEPVVGDEAGELARRRFGGTGS
jgi:hypothetical protein